MLTLTPETPTESFVSVHDMAEELDIELTSEQSRVVALALTLISSDLGLPVGDKKYRVTKDNTDYEQQLADRQHLSIEEQAQLPALKKRVSQSYTVKSFDRSMIYHFNQLCIVLNISR